MEHTKVRELYPEQHTNFWERPHLFKPQENGESFEDVLIRVKKAWNDIINAGGDNVLIVAHAVVLKALYMIIKNLEIKYLWNPPFMRDTCLTIVEVKDNKIEFLLEGDISHLE